MFKYSLNDLMKVLYKEKTMARLDRYQAGQVFYRFELDGSIYEFAIDTITTPTQAESEPYGASIKLSEDLGTTAFVANVRASELSRWIRPAVLTSQLKEIL
jgi:hypothetical protein